MKKLLVFGFALAGMAAAAQLEAQVISRNPVNARADANVSGSWRVVGRDGSGNSVYERSTRDRNGNIVIQRARRNSNGGMTVISSRTVRDDNRNRNNCDYNRSTNTVGDILFGRTNDRVCDDEYSREDNGWYQVGRGRDNNSIYERRTRDRNGNLIIQRARRNSNGTLTIISTRRTNDNDRQWKRDKQHEKEHRKAEKRHEKSHDRMDRDHDRDTDDNRKRR